MTTFSILDPDSGVAALDNDSTLISLEEAKRLHEIGVLTTSGLVLIYFRTETETLDNKEVYESLGIPRASFYRAVSTLELKGLIPKGSASFHRNRN